MKTRRTLVYGPVPSRRFGISLGVDLVPYKTCCYDCIYCELGRTTRLTVEREDFYPLPWILSDLGWALERGPRPEVITLAGSGEPTLFRSLGSLVRGIHRMVDIPVVLLTNGGLLFRDDVALDVMEVDILAPSLDAGGQETFKKMNRPHPEITFDRMLTGLSQVASQFKGEIRIEIVLARGANDNEAEWRAIADSLGKVRHTSLDVSTVVRPSLSAEVSSCGGETLQAACRALGPRSRLVAAFPSRPRPREQLGGSVNQNAERVRAMLSRRPCTLRDLAAGLALHPNEITKLLALLLREGKVEERSGGENSFFVATAAHRS